MPRLYLRWPTVGVKHDDTFALTYLAQLLTASRTARLTKVLVYDRQSAAQVNAFQAGNESAGGFNALVKGL